MKIVSISTFEATSQKSLRIVPIGLKTNPTPTEKIGFKIYQKFVGWFLSLIGITFRLVDAENKIFYVNKKSLIGWAKTNGASSDFQLKNLDQLLINILQNQLIQQRPQNQPIQQRPQTFRTEKESKLEEMVNKWIEFEELFHQAMLPDKYTIAKSLKNSGMCSFPEEVIKPISEVFIRKALEKNEDHAHRLLTFFTTAQQDEELLSAVAQKFLVTLPQNQQQIFQNWFLGDSKLSDDYGFCFS